MSEVKRPEPSWEDSNLPTLEWIAAANRYMDELEAERDRLRERDGQATIELCFDDGDSPFARRLLAVVDFGVADNIYVVEDTHD